MEALKIGGVSTQGRCQNPMAASWKERYADVAYKLDPEEVCLGTGAWRKGDISDSISTERGTRAKHVQITEISG
jgi:hypothetical protein